ncbi:hypothetical protein L1887_20273 [Cichorium endivia]|nr:hypothetical protein L1887_20273 [Cichorium endivia]
MDAVPIIDQKQPHVVFIPFPAQSHIKCMLKLARILHGKGLHITFINTQANHKRLLKSSWTRWLDGAPGFQFKTIPDGLPNSTTDDGAEHTQTILKIPIILFWTMAASGFMGFYQAKVLMEKGLVPLEDESYLTNGYLEMEIHWIPGMEGIRLKELPHEVTRFTAMNDTVFKIFLETAQAADKVSHMIIHTFEELEASLVKELKSTFLNVYSVGPLELLLNQITENETKKSNVSGYSLWKEEPECVRWLQSKEPNSVVYVNFGSITVMSLPDLLEFGWGLVNSDLEFLWIIRTDLVDGKPVVLPQELEEAMNHKGFVASWCSQEEVLNHPSVGGFLTHGGWGSIIESLSAGVPMICWPVSGDQQTNCRQMCKEWKVGMEISGNVKKEEIAKLVKELMEGEEGKRMRKKALEWKKVAEKATGSNGSSYLDTEKLANEIIKLSRH